MVLNKKPDDVDETKLRVETENKLEHDHGSEDDKGFFISDKFRFHSLAAACARGAGGS
jgi:hypothetical protein